MLPVLAGYEDEIQYIGNRTLNMDDFKTLFSGFLNDNVVLAFAHCVALSTLRSNFRDRRQILLLDNHFGDSLSHKNTYKLIAANPEFQKVLWITLASSTPDLYSTWKILWQRMAWSSSPFMSTKLIGRASSATFGGQAWPIMILFAH